MSEFEIRLSIFLLNAKLFILNALRQLTWKQLAAITLFGFVIIAPDVVGAATHDWPWETFLNSLVETFTGTTAKILAALGICIAAFGLFAGDAGGGIRKALMIIMGVSIAVYAVDLVNYLYEDSGASGGGF